MTKVELGSIDWTKVMLEKHLMAQRRSIAGLVERLVKRTKVIKPGRGYKALNLAPSRKNGPVEVKISNSGLERRRKELKNLDESADLLKRMLH